MISIESRGRGVIHHALPTKLDDFSEGKILFAPRSGETPTAGRHRGVERAGKSENDNDISASGKGTARRAPTPKPKTKKRDTPINKGKSDSSETHSSTTAEAIQL